MTSLVEADDISRALVLWIGYGRAASPQRDDSAIVAAFGGDRAPLVLDALRALKTDFYAAEAWNVGTDLVAVGDQAALEFRARHPEVSDQGVSALRWAYTFDHR